MSALSPLDAGQFVGQVVTVTVVHRSAGRGSPAEVLTGRVPALGRKAGATPRSRPWCLVLDGGDAGEGVSIVALRSITSCVPAVPAAAFGPARKVPARSSADTVLLLDVDGVLNVEDGSAWGEVLMGGGEASCYGRTYWLDWSESAMARLRALAEHPRVEIRWCTTWCGATEQLERLFGLPALSEAFGGIERSEAPEYKLAAARGVLAEGRRLIWVDDDEAPVQGEALYEALSGRGRSLLIRPDASRGLEPSHFGLIEAFLEDGGGRARSTTAEP